MKVFIILDFDDECSVLLLLMNRKVFCIIFLTELTNTKKKYCQ